MKDIEWPGGVVEVTDATIEAFLDKYPYSVVQMSTSWCGPCRRLSPVIADLAVEFHGRVSFCKIDLGENRSTGEAFKVSAVPTVYFFKDGADVHSITGFKPRDEFSRLVERLLNDEFVVKESE